MTEAPKDRAPRSEPAPDALEVTRASLAPATLRGRPSAEIGEARLEKLYEIAWRHFILHGLEGARIQLIAREAGVSRQTIFNRFGDKRSFFHEVTEKRESRFLQRAGFDPTDEQRDPAVVLEELGLSILEHLLLPESINHSRSLYGGLHRFPDLRDAEGRAYQRARDTLADYLDRAARRRGVEIDRTACARDFLALINGLVAPVLLGFSRPPRRSARRDMVRGVVRRFLLGVELAGAQQPPSVAPAKGRRRKTP